MENSIPQINSRKHESTQKVEKLFDHCFEIKNIQDGDSIVVGGNTLFPKTVKKMIGDFENSKDFFEDIHKKNEESNLLKIKEELTSKGIEFDEKLFAKLYAFNIEYAKKYPPNPEGEMLREQLYKEKDKEIKLSDVLKLNSAECAEISALAQFSLQKEGVQSSYFSGEVVWDKNDEEGCIAHTFIIIKHDGKTYIYDPSNPLHIPSGTFPNISTMEKDFDNEVRMNQKRFITATNIFSKKEAYYGVGNGSNFNPEKHIA